MKKTQKFLAALILVGSAVFVTACSTKEKAIVSAIDLSVYPKSDMFITVEEAIGLIGKKDVMFVSGDSPDLYVNFHIRGSVVIDAHAIHHAEKGLMHCAPLYQCVKDAEALVSHKGISNDTMIVAYDNYKGSNSTAVYSFFKSIGHKNIKMLMGGFKGIEAFDPAAQAYKKLKKDFNLGDIMRGLEESAEDLGYKSFIR